VEWDSDWEMRDCDDLLSLGKKEEEEEKERVKTSAFKQRQEYQQ